MRRLILVFTGLLGLQLMPAPAAIGACSTGWTPTSSPGGTFAADVAAIDVDTAWYVASAFDAGHTDEGWVSTFDGVTWTQRDFPQPGPSERIKAVSGTGDDDVWIVGDYLTPVDEESRAYIAHWDGAAFTRFAVDAGRSPSLTDVDALAPDDVWAVGRHFVDRHYRTLAMHWDGVAWTEIATPMPPRAERFFNSVDMIASDDVWAVGKASKRREGRPLAMRWNGSKWRRTPLPDVGTNNPVFNAVSAVRHDRAWAVGQVDNGAGTLIMRWDGAAWTVVPSPNPNANYNALAGVADVTAKKAWAVGGKDSVRPLLLRWNGTTWRAIRTPGGKDPRHLDAIDAAPDGSMMIVGTYAPAEGGLALQRCPSP